MIHYRATTRRRLSVVLRVVLVAASVVVAALLVGRAIDIEHGSERCSQVSITMDGLQPVAWEPIGWQVEDDYLACPITGDWWHLEKDGSVSIRNNP